MDHDAVYLKNHRSNNLEKLRATEARSRAKKKDKHKEWARAHYLKNKEAYKARSKAQRETTPAEVIRARSKARRLANPERSAAYSKTYRKKNLARSAANARARQARVRNQQPAWASRDAMLAFYSEAQKLTASTGVLHHVDHIVPLNSPIVCGLHCEANLQVLRYDENIRKGNRLQ